MTAALAYGPVLELRSVFAFYHKIYSKDANAALNLAMKA